MYLLGNVAKVFLTTKCMKIAQIEYKRRTYLFMLTREQLNINLKKNIFNKDILSARKGRQILSAKLFLSKKTSKLHLKRMMTYNCINYRLACLSLEALALDHQTQDVVGKCTESGNCADMEIAEPQVSLASKSSLTFGSNRRFSISQMSS